MIRRDVAIWKEDERMRIGRILEVPYADRILLLAMLSLLLLTRSRQIPDAYEVKDTYPVYLSLSAKVGSAGCSK